jgi:hypothetical protein
MTREKIAATLFETTCIGFFGGFAGGVLLYFAIVLKAEAAAREMDAMSSASHMCGAGTAAFVLAVLSVPAGTIFGFCLGAFFLWRESVAERCPLP